MSVIFAPGIIAHFGSFTPPVTRLIRKEFKGLTVKLVDTTESDNADLNNFKNGVNLMLVLLCPLDAQNKVGRVLHGIEGF